MDIHSSSGRGAALRVPPEILQQIYMLLNPLDFNAARDSCLSWHYASLDPWILIPQIRRGGWLSALEKDDGTIRTDVDRLSSVLARECVLAGRADDMPSSNQGTWVEEELSLWGSCGADLQSVGRT